MPQYAAGFTLSTNLIHDAPQGCRDTPSRFRLLAECQHELLVSFLLQRPAGPRHLVPLVRIITHSRLR